MSPGIGLMKRRLEKEKDAIALAISGIAKNYNTPPDQIKTLETKYDDDAGDWYVALGWELSVQSSRWILFREQLLKLKKFNCQLSL